MHEWAEGQDTNENVSGEVEAEAAKGKRSTGPQEPGEDRMVRRTSERTKLDRVAATTAFPLFQDEGVQCDMDEQMVVRRTSGTTQSEPDLGVGQARPHHGQGGL